MKRKPAVTSAHSVKEPPAPSHHDRWRSLWIACLAALFAATPVIPTEAAQLGGSPMAIVLLWLLLLLAWAGSGVAAGRLEWRGGPAVWVMLVFVGWIAISALVMIRSGQPRATINSTSQWLCFGLMFVLTRQLVRTPAESRALMSLMIALAATLAVTGYAQYFYENPAARQRYRDDPEQALRDANFVAPPGTPQRDAFENRLAAVEPFATFSLTNSLAGFLTTWLIVALGLGMTNWSGGSASQSSRVAMIVTAAVMIGCLVLTKSRSAFIATGVGAMLLAFFGRNTGWRPDARIAAIVGAILVLAPIVGIAVGGLDKEVLMEAPKSLYFRFQYWQATAELIRDSPIFGCGPGNFQQYYTAYKLPDASETIAEPHNFVFEIGANAGVPALIAFVAFLLAVVWQSRIGQRQLQVPPATESTPAAPRDDLAPQISSLRMVYGGGITGAIAGYIACALLEGYVPTPSFLLAWITIGAGTLWLWHRWVVAGRVTQAVPAIAIIALLINLSAAGALGFAGVSQSLWLLATVVISAGAGIANPQMLSPKKGLGIVMVGIVALGVFAYFGYLPTIRCRTALQNADSFMARQRYPETIAALEKAAQDDSYASEPWQRLAGLTLQGWLQTGDSHYEEAFVHASQKYLELDPHSSSSHILVANSWLAAYRRFGKRAQMDEAIRCQRIAMELYPNYNLGHAQLAWILNVAGDKAGAAKEAAESLRLDGRTPHREQKLNRQSLTDYRFQRESPTAPFGEVTINAEQAMLELRKTEGSEH